ncbi:hypothetical protein Rsub_01329 [Raphidocelis subcapitata]|uniref:Uncharacterized protein n=1 Tax=Raphidocelis subcapitata TaxID=307507 RepID=A0A2V0NMA9_9CHLO|nr:hypothetical protein Rsub_01329 [Raphidocelis subcapitata]|eukprot:GBF88614.1 hypothetical protein Rsub_01329 [Raphidocelis subcapitata]
MVNPVDAACLAACDVLERGASFLAGPGGTEALMAMSSRARNAAAAARDAAPSPRALARLAALAAGPDPAICRMALQLICELKAGLGPSRAAAIAGHAGLAAAIAAALRDQRAGPQVVLKRRAAALAARDLLAEPAARDAFEAQPSDPLAALVELVTFPVVMEEGGPAPPPPPPAQVFGPAFAALGAFLEPQSSAEPPRRCAALDARCRGRGGGAPAGGGCALDGLRLNAIFALQPGLTVDAWHGVARFVMAAVQAYPRQDVARCLASKQLVGSLLRLVRLAPSSRGACPRGCSCGVRESELNAGYAVTARDHALGALLALMQRLNANPALAEAISSDEAALAALAAMLGPPRPDIMGDALSAYESDPGPGAPTAVACSLLMLAALGGGAAARCRIALAEGMPAAIAHLLTPSAADPRTRCAGVVLSALSLLSKLLSAQVGEEMATPFLSRGIGQAARGPLLESLRSLGSMHRGGSDSEGEGDSKGEGEGEGEEAGGSGGEEEDDGGAAAAEALFGATLSPQLRGSLAQGASMARFCHLQLHMFFNSALGQILE